ncbi:MAG: enoyl-CoA hydratase/isomerase family protein [Hyphomicrobiales bacterium]|nr:MAG: enoyl-CoA hydratase/isomerase family protein [Hyphomicrobiales bacterium]
MTEFDTIAIEHTEHISWIVLNRPQTANALSHALLEDVSVALRMLRTEGAKVLGVRGAGKGFSAGYDLGDVAYADLSGNHPVKDRERLQSYMNHYLEIWDHPKPIIAAVHGYCIGGATQLCTFADMTIVAEDASVGESVVPIGGGFVAPTWVPLVGVRRAKEMTYIPGHRIDGKTAAEWGWANFAVPADRVFNIAESYAERIGRMPADALRIKKLSANRAAEANGPREVAAFVAEMNAMTHATPGIAALRSWLASVGLKSAAHAYATGEGLPEEVR